MKTRFWAVFLSGAIFVWLIMGMTGTGLAGAWEDAQRLKRSGEQASSSAQGTNPNYERARSQAGSGWDTKYQSPPPPVHLPHDRVGVNPHDLKKYDPKPGKLQKVVPPPPTPN